MLSVKKLIRVAVCAVLAVVLLAGCGLASFDPKAQVQGNLDAMYLNQYSEKYLEAVVDTKEELQQMYREGLGVEADYFINYFEIVPEKCPDTLRDDIIDMYEDIYSHSKYEVGNAAKSGDTYLVSVTVYPIDIVQKVMDEDADAFMEAWYANDELANATEEEIEAAWAEGIIDMFKARVATIGYLEPETISVQIVKNENGKYTISQNDMDRIDALMIQY